MKKAGDKHNDWTLVEMVQGGANAYMRRWLCRCKCGFAAQKWEADLKANVTACVTCRRNDKANKQVQP